MYNSVTVTDKSLTVTDPQLPSNVCWVLTQAAALLGHWSNICIQICIQRNLDVEICISLYTILNQLRHITTEQMLAYR